MVISDAVTKVDVGELDAVSNASASSALSISAGAASFEPDTVSDVSARTLSATTKSAASVCTASTVADVEEAQVGTGYMSAKEPWHSS